ncbi:hypothetical protein AXF41_14555 [Clostridium haemolyticum]|nr:hypothetical protein AXF41_14555 [Clostridium haemolyticum]
MRELITIISEKEVKRRTNIRTNEHNKEKFKKLRRNENGLTKKQQEKIDRLESVQDLKDKGYKQKEIAIKLEISIRTVKDCYKELRFRRRK